MNKADVANTVLITFSAIGAAIGGWLIVNGIRLLCNPVNERTSTMKNCNPALPVAESPRDFLHDARSITEHFFPPLRRFVTEANAEKGDAAIADWENEREEGRHYHGR
jgi:hypothetical protein